VVFSAIDGRESFIYLLLRVVSGHAWPMISIRRPLAPPDLTALGHCASMA
jgi:hypothetical protein